MSQNFDLNAEYQLKTKDAILAAIHSSHSPLKVDDLVRETTSWMNVSKPDVRYCLLAMIRERQVFLIDETRTLVTLPQGYKLVSDKEEEFYRYANPGEMLLSPKGTVEMQEYTTNGDGVVFKGYHIIVEPVD